VASDTFTLTGFTDLDQMAVFASWSVANVDAGGSGDTLFDVYLSGVNEVTAIRGGTPTKVATIRGFAVQFGADTNVYKGTLAMTNAETSDTSVQINGGSAMALNDLTKAFVTHTWQVPTGTVGNGWHWANLLVSGEFADTSNLTFTRGVAETAVSGHWQVIESSTLSVQHGSVQFTTESDPTDSFTSVGADLSHTFLMASWHTSSTYTYFDDGWDFWLSNTTTFAAHREDANITPNEVRYQVITDSEVSVQRGTETSGFSGTAALSPAVDTDFAIAKAASGHLPSGATANYDLGGGHTLMHEFYITTNVTPGDQITWVSGNNPPQAMQLSWETVEFTEYTAPSGTARRVMVIT
jgi:hypothetical protein